MSAPDPKGTGHDGPPADGDGAEPVDAVDESSEDSFPASDAPEGWAGPPGS